MVGDFGSQSVFLPSKFPSLHNNMGDGRRMTPARWEKDVSLLISFRNFFCCRAWSRVDLFRSPIGLTKVVFLFFRTYNQDLKSALKFAMTLLAPVCLIGTLRMISYLIFSVNANPETYRFYINFGTLLLSARRFWRWCDEKRKTKEEIERNQKGIQMFLRIIAKYHNFTIDKILRLLFFSYRNIINSLLGTLFADILISS